MRKYPAVPHPFIIEPPTSLRIEYNKKEKLNFALILIGRVIEYLPYFIYTFHELGKTGIGKGRGKYILEKVESLSPTKKTTVYHEKDKLLHDCYHIITINSFQEIYSHLAQNKIALKFITPTRIKYEERLTENLEFHILIRNLIRRISLLSYFHCDEEFKKEEIKLLIDKAKKIKIENKDLKWYDWERYSSRQDTMMKLGGFTGDITYVGKDLKDFLPYILLGTYTHVGKGATFGLGKYEINI